MLRLENVYKSYGAIKVLEGMSLRVEAGNSLCVLGRSGCGKSTLLKLIALMMKPDSGSVFVGGKDIAKMTDGEVEATRRENMAYSFQEPLLIPYVTALENVTLVTGAPKAEAVEVLTRFGLGDRLSQRPPKLSGGERKRVDIARAVLKKSNFLIVDEPLSNLDPESGSIVMESLTRHASGEGVLVYSTVEPAQARFASEVVEMNAK